MIGSTITASTTPAVKMLPPPASDTSPALNGKNQSNLWFSADSIGASCGARTKIPQSPNTIDGTAASKSTIAPKRRDNLAGAY